MNDAAAAPRIDANEGDAGTSRMSFTGRGDEYFRIWVVNLFLTVLTLGIYSAWAKVRKTRYFWQNSRLDGSVFDFHGNPVAILKGRILALVLVVAYTWSFEFSLAAGLVTIAVLLAAGPWLFMKSQKFKLGNTSFRGLRFGFVASYKDSVRIVLPILVVWFSTTVVAAFVGEEVGGMLGLLLLISIGTTLLIPWMHHRLKWFQHERASYGDRRFSFQPVTAAFYRTYAKGVGLAIAGAVVGMIVVGLVVTPLVVVAKAGTDEPPEWLWISVGVTYLVVVYVFVWPYLAARLQQFVWASTTLDDIRFRTEIAAWPLAKLVLQNIGLTLLTLGLYWPYAAVALARYRVECMRVVSDAPLSAIAAGVEAAPATALGDAAADSFGLDIGI